MEVSSRSPARTVLAIRGWKSTSRTTRVSPVPITRANATQKRLSGPWPAARTHPNSTTTVVNEPFASVQKNSNAWAHRLPTTTRTFFWTWVKGQKLSAPIAQRFTLTTQHLGTPKQFRPELLGQKRPKANSCRTKTREHHSPQSGCETKHPPSISR